MTRDEYLKSLTAHEPKLVIGRVLFDLRPSLTSIQIALALLEDKLGEDQLTDSDSHEAINKAHDALNHISEVLDALSEYAKSDTAS